MNYTLLVGFLTLADYQNHLRYFLKLHILNQIAKILIH